MGRSTRAGWWWATKTARRRLWVTLAALLAYLLAAHVPTPGLAASRPLTQSADGGIGGVLALLAALTGGSAAQFSILSIGVYAVIAGHLLVYNAGAQGRSIGRGPWVGGVFARR